MTDTIVLIHSPLVGPSTWSLVAGHLVGRGVRVLVPVFHGTEETHAPWWKQQADAVARQLAPLPADQPLVLVGHSGAGPLLPAMGKLLDQPVAGYVFVDAGLPQGGRSYLDEMEANIPAFAAELRHHLQSGGRFPDWTDEVLQTTIPDDSLRREVLTELQPRPLAFFEEPLPVVADWPDAPCGYVKFTDSYARHADRARAMGWTYREFDAGHFHMLVAPEDVATALTDVVESLQE
jgi:pimeloyl-ACP methyl ester carboxylesterase